MKWTSHLAQRWTKIPGAQQQQSICEIMAGNIIKHSFWVTNRSDSTIASFEDLDNVPLFYKYAKYAEDIIKFLDENPD